MLQDCAWAPSGEQDTPDQYYLEALGTLCSSSIWENNSTVQQHVQLAQRSQGKIIILLPCINFVPVAL